MNEEIRNTSVFKNRWFIRFAHKESIEDSDLCTVIKNAQSGLIDANLGGGVIKQRIGQHNQGKSGGYRVIVLFRNSDRAFFIYGFKKNKRDNIRMDELKGFRALADELLNYEDDKIARMLKRGVIEEVECNEKEISQ